MNINKRKNSAALAAKKGIIDFRGIDNIRLHFISPNASFSRLCGQTLNLCSQLWDYLYGAWKLCTYFYEKC